VRDVIAGRQVTSSGQVRRTGRARLCFFVAVTAAWKLTGDGVGLQCFLAGVCIRLTAAAMQRRRALSDECVCLGRGGLLRRLPLAVLPSYVGIVASVLLVADC